MPRRPTWPLLLALGVLAGPAPAYALEWFNLPFLGKNAAPAADVSGTEAGTDDTGAPLAKRPNAPAVDVKNARVRILDKRNNRLSELTLTVGTPQDAGAAPGQAGSLSLTLGRCVRDIDGVPGQDTAWLTITEHGTTPSTPLFSGWMFNLNPDVAALDHPVYDVRLMGCTRPGQKTGATDPTAKPAEVKVILDATPAAEDTETEGTGTAPMETPAAPAAQVGSAEPDPAAPPTAPLPSSPDATDPYAVPGVPDSAPAPTPQPAPATPDDELQRLIEQQ
jgi:hypothetical protein